MYQVGSGYAALGGWGLRLRGAPGLAGQAGAQAETWEMSSAGYAGEVTDNATFAAVLVIGGSMVLDALGPGSEAALVDDVVEQAAKQADVLARQADEVMAAGSR